MNLKYQAQQALKIAPKKTRSVVLSIDFHATFEDIAKKYNISSEKHFEIENLVIYTVLKLIDQNEFKDEIIKIITNNENITDNFIHDINQKIINNIDNLYIESLNTIKMEEEEKGNEFKIEDYIYLDTDLYEILDKSIEQRIKEISDKYELKPEQTKELTKEVVIFIDNKLPRISSREIVSKLEVSNVIIEQLTLEIENRILGYIIKQNITTTNKKETFNERNVNQVDTKQSLIKKEEKVISDIPNYTPRPKVVIDDEPVQTPIPVPRFKAVPMSDIESGQDFMPKVAPKPNVGGIMQNKLNTVTEKAPTRPPVPEKYSVDPYREPLN